MVPPDPTASRLETGTVLSHYRIDETLGAGGMGVVYRATDLRLNRPVAIKVIGRDVIDGDLRARFIKEARAASTFNHTNIITIHEVDSADGVDFIVMELLSGQSLHQRIAAGAMPIDDVLAIAGQIAAALDAAHAAGVVHRDIKPANVMVGESGHVKVLDFGIAKQLAPSALADAETLTAMEATRPGIVLGSLGYMSPEQAQGYAIDGRSDVFSFGVLLYEMLSGRRPFGGNTPVETIAKILEATPLPLTVARKDVPPALAALVAACLEKGRQQRPTAHEVHSQLSEIGRTRTAGSASLGAVLRRPAVAATVAIMLSAAAGGGAWWWASGRDVRQARARLPEILAAGERGDRHAFYRDARTIVSLLPDDARLQQLWTNNTLPVSIASQPPGASVYVKGYAAPDDDWVALGQTPVGPVHVPIGTTRVKVVKDGYAPFDGTLLGLEMNFVLDPVDAVQPGMVRVMKTGVSLEGITVEPPDFWMDRFEVTNRQFKEFVEAGGYRKREYWREPLIDNGQTVAWEAAMKRFVDRTGRPGPSTWELGSYRPGQADHAVAGVSWYEAAAFAAFAGKSLPTAFQWRTAVVFSGIGGVWGDILLHSNFGTAGPVAVGSTKGISPYGQYDMAGNVKEWCWNEAGGGRRMILGGGFNEPNYMFQDRDAQPPFTREPTYGFRLVRNIDPQPAASYALVPPPVRDYSVEKPVDAAAFALIRNLYNYDPQPLNARVEAASDLPEWRRETVTLDAVYGDERIIAYIYLPASAAPPYQTIVYFPGGDAQLIRTSRELNLTNVDFVIRSGRALVFPVYQGTYERPFQSTGPNSSRDLVIARVKDFSRVMEYIATRRDLDLDRLGYYGSSMGAYHGVLISALEPRLKANVWMGGGLSRAPLPPQIDPLNFVTRVHVPTLMVNGDGDFQTPLTQAQLPLFRLLSLPADQKRHALFKGGHMPTQIHDVMREILDWFDRFLGPVTSQPRS